MTTNRVVVDLGPDEHARLDAEGRRRGLNADAVLVELVRALPEPDTDNRMSQALQGLRELRERMPEISQSEMEAALTSSRTDLEGRAAPEARDG
jgi:hypothetical protein